jgi:hypothetical protein
MRPYHSFSFRRGHRSRRARAGSYLNTFAAKVK